MSNDSLVCHPRGTLAKFVRSLDIEPPWCLGCVFGFLLFSVTRYALRPPPFFPSRSIRRRVVLSVSSCIGIRSAVASLGTRRFLEA